LAPRAKKVAAEQEFLMVTDHENVLYYGTASLRSGADAYVTGWKKSRALQTAEDVAIGQDGSKFLITHELNTFAGRSLRKLVGIINEYDIWGDVAHDYQPKNLSRVDVDPYGQPWVLDMKGQIHQLIGTDWIIQEGDAIAISSGKRDKETWYLNSYGQPKKM
jgi:hypothetical protein